MGCAAHVGASLTANRSEGDDVARQMYPRSMAPPVAILVETRPLPPHPATPGWTLVVEVWRRDGWYAFRVVATDESGVPTVDADSGIRWFETADGAAEAGRVHLLEHLPGN